MCHLFWGIGQGRHFCLQIGLNNTNMVVDVEILLLVKVAYTSGPIFEKIMKRYPIFSMQIINYQIDQKYK